MSELPPLEPELSKQLARRASGRLPDDLLADVRARLEIAPDTAPRTPAPALGIPRLVYAGAAVGLAALLVVAVAVPAFRPAPAGPVSGYPAQRALTTVELSAAVASGPALNTALVADVTIRPDSQACAWNRYPTIGVIEGAASQICVMGYDLSARFTSARSGVFALRFLAPGVVGLIGQLRSGPSRLAFHVTEQWPTDGSAFLVEGQLGGTALPCASPSIEIGDVLKPAGLEECTWSWLSEDGSASTDGLGTTASGSPFVDPGVDLLALRGKARHVEAAGVRHIDAVPSGTSQGVWVVEPTGGPCLGSSPLISVGCMTWRVMARVPELSLPAIPSPPQPSSTSRDYWDPAVRPLTAAELPRAISVAQTEQILVADVSIQPAPDCAYPFNAAIYTIIGRLNVPGNEVCVVGLGDGAAWHKPSASQGVFAFRVLDRGYLAFMGEIGYPGSRGLAYAADEAWPDGQTIMATGWVVSMPASYPCPTWGGGLSPLDPDSPDCPEAWLANGPMREDQARSAVDGGDAHPVALPYLASGDPAHVVSTEAVYLVRDEATVCGANDPNLPDRAACSWQIMGRVAPLALPPASGPAATLTPTPEPPATPVTAPLASGAGLAGPGGRPLTQAELAQAWAADPNHLAGRIVITKGAVHAGFLCWDAGAANPSAAPGSCNLGMLEGSIAPEGYWAVRVGADGRLAVLGELRMPSSSFVFSVPAACGNPNLRPGSLLMVSGILTQLGGSWQLVHSGTIGASDCGSIDLGTGPYASIAPVVSGVSSRAGLAFYLVQVGSPWKVLTRIQPVAAQG